MQFLYGRLTTFASEAGTLRWIAPSGASLLLALLLAACSEDPALSNMAGESPIADPTLGHGIAAAAGCGACHVIPGVPGARGRVGPDLTGFARRAYLAGIAPNTRENLVAFLEDPAALSPQTAMPATGLTPEEAHHLAAYLEKATDTAPR